MAVNEVDYTSVIVWTVGPGKRQRRREVCVVVRRCCCSAHTGNEVSTCVGGAVKRSCVCILALWKLCGFCGIVCGLQVASQHFIKNGVLEAQDGVVVGVVWPLLSDLASGPLRTLNEHFRV